MYQGKVEVIVKNKDDYEILTRVLDYAKPEDRRLIARIASDSLEAGHSVITRPYG
jgi:hypothetical protein